MHLLLLIHAVQSSPFKMSWLVVFLTSGKQKIDEVVRKDSDFQQVEIIFCPVFYLEYICLTTIIPFLKANKIYIFKSQSFLIT